MEHKIDMWRFYDELENIKKKEPVENCTLFYGSSTFAHWVSIEDDFKEYNARNAGFGGSTSDEALFHYDSIVNKFKPSILLWYFGDNEPVCGYTLKETIEMFDEMFDRFHKDYPNSLIIIVGTKSSYARKEYYDYVVGLNKYEKEIASRKDYIEYVDTSDIYYKDGDYNLDNFCEDKLHFNMQGNNLIATKIKKIIDSKRNLQVNVEEKLNDVKKN